MLSYKQELELIRDEIVSDYELRVLYKLEAETQNYLSQTRFTSREKMKEELKLENSFKDLIKFKVGSKIQELELNLKVDNLETMSELQKLVFDELEKLDWLELE